MGKARWAWSVVISLVLCARAALAAGEPWSGLYRITGGDYVECCGIGGNSFRQHLPNSRQTYLRLRVDQRSNLAQMSFLESNMQTISHPTFVSGYGFSFSNGVICPGGVDPFGQPGSILFGDALVEPCSNLPFEGYIVHYREATLVIDGARTAPCEGCSDIPTHFSHSNVTAVLTGPTIDNIDNRGSALRFHFTGEPPYYYMVEFKDSLSAEDWRTLAMYQATVTNISVTVTNSFTNATTRFFRVRMQRETAISGEGNH